MSDAAVATTTTTTTKKPATGAATTTAAAAPPEPAAPWSDPPAYLLSRGWRPLGDPKSPATRWLDPTKPLIDKDELRTVDLPVLPGSPPKSVTQLHHTPRAWPMSLDEALQSQLWRDEWDARQKAMLEAALERERQEEEYARQQQEADRRASAGLPPLSRR